MKCDICYFLLGVLFLKKMKCDIYNNNNNIKSMYE